MLAIEALLRYVSFPQAADTLGMSIQDWNCLSAGEATLKAQRPEHSRVKLPARGVNECYYYIIIIIYEEKKKKKRFFS